MTGVRQKVNQTAKEVIEFVSGGLILIGVVWLIQSFYSNSARYDRCMSSAMNMEAATAKHDQTFQQANANITITQVLEADCKAEYPTN